MKYPDDKALGCRAQMKVNRVRARTFSPLTWLQAQLPKLTIIVRFEEPYQQDCLGLNGGMVGNIDRTLRSTCECAIGSRLVGRVACTFGVRAPVPKPLCSLHSIFSNCGHARKGHQRLPITNDIRHLFKQTAIKLI